MELDLGLRISRTVENLTFSSTETDTVFVLLVHLPGFKKDEIEISINEAGTKISISGGGERSSIETTISRRLTLATEVIERFQKEFRIPNGVALDRIDAGFDEENAVLIVLMPKLIKGDVSGVEIEEIKQGEDEGEEGKEASLEQEKQEGGGATGKEEEQEEKGEGKETPIREDEQEEKGADDEGLMKEKEQEVKGEPEKEQMGMEQKRPEEEIEEVRGTRVVPDQPPTPSVPVETHDLGEKPPSTEAPEPKEEEHEKELQIPAAPSSTPTSQEPIKKLDIDQQDELPPGVFQPTETPEIDQATDRSEEQEGVILVDEGSDQASEALRSPQEPHEDSNLHQTKALDSAEKDRQIANGIEGRERERVGEEKREGNGNGSEKKGRKKGKGKDLSLPLAPSLTTSAFILSLAVLAYHFLRRKKK